MSTHPATDTVPLAQKRPRGLPFGGVRRGAALSCILMLLASTVAAQNPAMSQPATASPPTHPKLLSQFKIVSPSDFNAEHPDDQGEFLVDTDNVTVDFLNSWIVGASDRTPADQFVGRAIVIRKAKNVTLKNVKIRGFKVAIYAEDAPGLRLENCDVSRNYRQHLKSTPQREHNDDWLWGHENDDNQWLRYGAGIYLLRCDDAKVVNCRARNGQNGICLSRCERVEITGNDMSFMSGWGLAMWRSCKCRVTSNRFDYCVRGYSHGVYNRGQDSAGILVYEQCSDNLFAFNSVTHGGDGFFLYAGNETLKQTGVGGCNRNVLYKNDFSYAVTNGIEATFSDRNVFVGNTLAHCDNGVWAGYSTKSLIAQNHFTYCNVGIALEHGRENKMEWNDFIECKRGIWLWWDEDADLLKSPYAIRQGHQSDGESIIYNLAKNCGEAVLLSRSTNVTLDNNRLEENKVALRLNQGSRIRGFHSNTFVGGLIENESGQDLIGRLNHNIGKNKVELKGKVTLELTEVLCNEGFDWGCRKGPLATEKEVPEPSVPATAKVAVTSLPHGTFPTPGRETIFIDEWGPYDFTEPRVFPAHCVGALPMRINVLGPPGTDFHILPGIDQNLEVTPVTGKTPCVVTIAPRSGPNPPEPGAYAFAFGVRIGNAEQRVTGVALIARWNVRYFSWTPALDPLVGDENWKKIVASTPIKTEQRDNLDMPWGGGGPTPEVTERFALTAETRLKLPAGKWRMRTISDDGVRVYFDGKRVIDNWTWHVPAEDKAELDVAAGPHDIRVEYFEITGHAQLQVFIEPFVGP